MNHYNSHWIQYFGYFDYRNHLCLVFELLDLSLYDFMKENSFKPFPMESIRHIAKQLLRSTACKFLKSIIDRERKEYIIDFYIYIYIYSLTRAEIDSYGYQTRKYPAS
jgi:serine/threonine protein kinase